MEFWLRLSVSGQQQLAAVGCRQMDIDHLDGGELLKSTARCQSWCQRIEPTLQSDLQTISQEGDEDMGFDPALFLMEDWPDREVALQVFERLLHGNELRVVLPQQRGIILREVGA